MVRESGEAARLTQAASFISVADHLIAATQERHTAGARHGAEAMPATPPGLSDEKAARMLAALREGKTLRLFGVRKVRLEAYFAAHPEYAHEARPLIAANAKAAQFQKGIHRDKTHCKYGHPLFGPTVYVRRNGKRQCLVCAKRRDSAPPPPSSEQLQQVTAALNAGKPLRLICFGMEGPKRTVRPIVSHIKLIAYRRQNPEFERFVRSAIAGNNSKAQLQRWNSERSRTDQIRAENNDYHKIKEMIPRHLPDDIRDDIAQAVFLSLFEGTIQRNQVKNRVRQFVQDHNRMFPTKFAKFGDSPLLSLDEVMFDDGSTTRGDNVSRGLWD
ncbi:hypothetical protein [Bradyrhizobium sp. B120]|uniref:hypothetical protein n=1 Tax=Bradyrhizobium sp. B120 TaxID=3410088 RepID=UPI003B980DC1